MAIYQMEKDSIAALPATTFAALGLREKTDLQRLLRDYIEVIAPGVLIVYEEFGEWSEGKRRIDLLGIDREANIVVIELKRTEDGGHMELQALRYAAMVSTLTFDQTIEIFDRYLKLREDDRDARDTLTEFLDWDDTQEDSFGQDVRIVLASADFSKELTTAVLWLRERSIDIRCVRIQPYENDGSVLLDVQQVVPLPEAEDYQIRVQRKSIKEREARNVSRDLTRYDVTVNSETYSNLPKRRAVLKVVAALVHAGVKPDELSPFVSWRNLFFKFEGQRLDAEQVVAAIINDKGESNVRRWFVSDDELIYHNGSTYAVCNQWGSKTEHTLKQMLKSFNSHNISITSSN